MTMKYEVGDVVQLTDDKRLLEKIFLGKGEANLIVTIEKINEEDGKYYFRKSLHEPPANWFVNEKCVARKIVTVINDWEKEMK